MKKFDGYLLVSDIDGTLADERYIPPANIEAIGRFMADGGQVVLATGRSPQSTLPVAKRLGCMGKVIANNGALVYDVAADKAVIEYALDCEQITHDILAAFQSVGAMFYCGSELWLVKDNYEMTKLIRSEGLTVKDSCDGTINKVIFGGDAETLDKIEQYCNGISDLEGDVVRSGPTIIEILPKGINKSSAMTDLAKQMGINPQHIFAAGNYFNDVAMMSAAALSCAPSDSPQEVKDKADYIACPCREGAIADFINHLYQEI